MNFDLKVKEVSLETFILTGKIDNREIIDNLINFIKNNKNEELSYRTNVKAHFTGFKSLVENIHFHNFLKMIQPYIKIIYQQSFKIEDAWGNFCKKNEEVIEHDHINASAFCGILYLSNDGPGTYFKQYDLLINEEIGKFVLFHPFLKHSVKKIDKEIERITVAFNMSLIRDWEDKSNAVWVNKK
jgi:hypothetical protein